jgi:hypothetical protein
MRIPKINRKKEIERFIKMHDEFDHLIQIEESMKKCTYMLQNEKEKIMDILDETKIRTLRNIEWQRKILGLSQEFVGDIPELIARVEASKKERKEKQEKDEKQWRSEESS